MMEGRGGGARGKGGVALFAIKNARGDEFDLELLGV